MWTTDQTCGPREAVDERGEQPRERAGSARDRARGKGGELGKERERKPNETVPGGEREKWTTGRKESNTLHVIFHFPSASTTTTTAAATAAATAAMRLQ